MGFRASIAVLAFVLGIGSSPSRTQAQLNYGDIYDYPAIKGQSAFSFLKIGQSPRAAGMGEAFSSMPGQIDAIFYNPGSVGFMQGRQYSFSYTNWLVNAKIYTGALAYRFGSNTVGISVISAKPEDVEETTILQSLGTGRTISASDLAIGLTYARQMTDKVSWGIQGKLVREDLMLSVTNSYQLDLGVSAYTGYRSLRLAAAARNVGGQVEVEVRPFNPPIYFNFGSSFELYGQLEEPTHLTVSAETLFATDYGQRWLFGGELWMGGVMAVRGGYKVNTDVEDWTLGLGLKHVVAGRQIRADVAYANGGDSFDAPLRFGLSGSF